MSGPKVSIYRVAPYIRENVLLQQKLKRKCITLQKQINERISRMEALSEKYNQLVRNRSDAERGLNGGSSYTALSEKIKNKKYEMISETHALGPMEKMPVKYRYSPETVTQDQKKVHKLEAVIKKYDTAIEEIQRQVVEMANAFHAEQKQEMKEVFTKHRIIGAFDFNDISVNTQKQHWEKRDKALKDLQALLADPILSANLHIKAKEAIQRLSSMEMDFQANNFVVIVVSDLLEEAEQERKRHQIELQEYKDRIAEYHAFCENLQTIPMDIPFNPDWREKLEEGWQELETISDQRNEKDYISDCLDTVMTEMGYKVIGYRDVKKKSGKQFHSSLYSYGEGRAINITQSDDGQITMELGGVDRCDRLPERQEAEALEADMYSFCDRFAEIEQRLKKKGVQLQDRISKPAPSQEYATIINLNDFILTSRENIDTIEVSDIVQTQSVKEMYEE